MLIAAHMVPHFESSLTQVRKAPVETREVNLSELRVRAPKVEQFRSVEASMRLDAVASAGFRTSRSKVADWIARGDVRCVGVRWLLLDGTCVGRVNWKTVTKGSAAVAQGDLISVSGKGRVAVMSATQTLKGKWAVELERSV